MTKSHLPAYVFRYTERTQEAFLIASQSLGAKFTIDVQNAAPPYENRSVQAWVSATGDKLCFENGSKAAVVVICYDDVVAHMRRVTENLYPAEEVAA